MKKWGKKLLGLLLCTVMIAGLLPAAAFAAPSYTAYELYVERPASEAGNPFLKLWNNSLKIIPISVTLISTWITTNPEGSLP